MRLEELLVKKIVVLDGACGTQLIAKGKQGCLELLNIDEPAVVESLHEEYLEAGADIITTNTTCADSLCLAEYGLQERSYEIVRAGAELKRSKDVYQGRKPRSFRYAVRQNNQGKNKVRCRFA